MTNYARRLNLTPYEDICKIWTSEPDRYILNPPPPDAGTEHLSNSRPEASGLTVQDQSKGNLYGYKSRQDIGGCHPEQQTDLLNAADDPWGREELIKLRSHHRQIYRIIARIESAMAPQINKIRPNRHQTKSQIVISTSTKRPNNLPVPI